MKRKQFWYVLDREYLYWNWNWNKEHYLYELLDLLVHCISLHIHQNIFCVSTKIPNYRFGWADETDLWVNNDWGSMTSQNNSNLYEKCFPLTSCCHFLLTWSQCQQMLTFMSIIIWHFMLYYSSIIRSWQKDVLGSVNRKWVWMSSVLRGTWPCCVLVHCGPCGHTGMKAVISKAIFPSLFLKVTLYWNSPLTKQLCNIKANGNTARYTQTQRKI